MNELGSIFQDTLMEEIELKAIRYLESGNESYQKLSKERTVIIDNYHNMLNFLEKNKSTHLSDKEHDALINYIEIESQLNGLIKFAIYLCGHSDCYTYLQMTSDLQND